MKLRKPPEQRSKMVCLISELSEALLSLPFCPFRCRSPVASVCECDQVSVSCRVSFISHYTLLWIAEVSATHATEPQCLVLGVHRRTNVVVLGRVLRYLLICSGTAVLLFGFLCRFPSCSIHALFVKPSTWQFIARAELHDVLYSSGSDSSC